MATGASMTESGMVMRRSIGIAAGAVVSAGVLSAATPPFGPLAMQTVFIPASLAAADLNRDGVPDLVITGATDTSVSLGDGAGGFREIERLPLAGVQVIVADANGDGIEDLLVLAPDGCAVRLAPGRGDGSFDPVADIALPCDAEAITFIDVTGDAEPDLIVGSSGSRSVTVLAGDGAGGFELVTTIQAPMNPGPGLFAAQDVDGDGAVDLVTSGLHGATVHFNDGSGGFDERLDVGAGDNLSHLTVLDMDGNGLHDIIAFNVSAQRISAYQQFSSRVFLPATSIAAVSRVGRIIAADADGDGRTDLVTLHNGTVFRSGAGDLRTEGGPGIPFRGGEIRVFRAGEGRLVESDRMFGGAWPQDVALSDVDGDGRPDLIAVARPLTETAFFLVQGARLSDEEGPGLVQVAFGIGRGVFAGAKRVFSARASGILLDDVDQDGDLDLAESQVVGVFVRRNAGDGAFNGDLGGVNSQGLPRFDQVFALGDATGDGVTDVLLGSSLGLRLAPGRSTGVFDMTRTVHPSIPTAIAVGDFTGDGAGDVVVGASTPPDGAAILLDPTSASLFTNAATLSIPADPRDVALGDFDGNGVTDIAFACGDGRAIAVASFAPTVVGLPVTVVPMAGRIRSIHAFDFDADGQLDLLAAEDGPAPAAVVLRNLGEGRFVSVGRLPVASITDVCACDATLDGWPDALVADGDNDRVVVFAGDGRGGFERVEDIFVGDFPRSLACGDLNGDRRPDIVVSANNENPNDITSRTFSAMTVHLNMIVPAGDLTGDRVIDALDLATLLADFGPCPATGPCRADLTGDGVVNGADISVVLSNFGF